jgi:hypothetical protein
MLEFEPLDWKSWAPAEPPPCAPAHPLIPWQADGVDAAELNLAIELPELELELV